MCYIVTDTDDSNSEVYGGQGSNTSESEDPIPELDSMNMQGSSDSEDDIELELEQPQSTPFNAYGRVIDSFESDETTTLDADNVMAWIQGNFEAGPFDENPHDHYLDPPYYGEDFELFPGEQEVSPTRPETPADSMYNNFHSSSGGASMYSSIMSVMRSGTPSVFMQHIGSKFLELTEIPSGARN